MAAALRPPFDDGDFGGGEAVEGADLAVKFRFPGARVVTLPGSLDGAKIIAQVLQQSSVPFRSN